MNRRTFAIAGVGIGITVLLTASSCEKFTEPYKDAPRSGFTNDDPADTITFPDGFSNVSTKCDHGNRIYSAYKGDANRSAIAVVPNAEDC